MTAASNPLAIILRDPNPGDMGWVVQQHGEIYWREYRWDARFEALVLKIVSGIVQKWQPTYEKCRVADVDGVRVDSAFVVRKSKTTARLRLLILTADARGLGWGADCGTNALRLRAAKAIKRWCCGQIQVCRRRVPFT